MTSRPARGGTNGQIAADIEARIVDGEFAPGGRLPSEAALATEYDATRGRVRTVLAALARRGVVVARPRVGWVAQARHRTQTFDRMLSFSQWADQHGRVVGGRVVGREDGPATAHEAQVLGIGLGEEVHRFTRTRTLDGRLVMVERSVWAPWVGRAVRAMPDDTGSVTGELGRAGIEVVRGEHRIEAVAASSLDADLLGVRRSSPLLQVSRATATRAGRPVEYGVDRYLPHVIAFDVTAGEMAGAG